MTMLTALKRRLPEPVRHAVRAWKLQSVQKRLSALPPCSENDFYRILTEDLGIQKGNVVFFHSSAEKLRPSFPLHHVLTILLDVVGAEGTLLTPSYPRQLSSEFLKSDLTFDVRRTPSYMGVISELLRRKSGSIRSLHPTKSVCAIGSHAYELTNTHQNSPYPYDSCSPYYKIMKHGGTIVSLGVSPLRISCVHCVEDALKDKFPINTYLETLFESKCINYKGEIEIIKTYAHNPLNTSRNTQKFIARNIVGYTDITRIGRRFFKIDAKSLFDQMINLAYSGITIYSYTKSRIF
jgi:aminoglycoside 3-N-acetyltransferase